MIHVERDLEYVRLRFTDENGIVKPLVRSKIKVSVTGGTLLGLGSACPYYEGSYLSDTCDTYYGEALAIIKPDGPGKICLQAVSEIGSCQLIIPVEA